MQFRCLGTDTAECQCSQICTALQVATAVGATARQWTNIDNVNRAALRLQPRVNACIPAGACQWRQIRLTPEYRVRAAATDISSGVPRCRLRDSDHSCQHGVRCRVRLCHRLCGIAVLSSLSACMRPTATALAVVVLTDFAMPAASAVPHYSRHCRGMPWQCRLCGQSTSVLSCTVLQSYFARAAVYLIISDCVCNFSRFIFARASRLLRTGPDLAQGGACVPCRAGFFCARGSLNPLGFALGPSTFFFLFFAKHFTVTDCT